MWSLSILFIAIILFGAALTLGFEIWMFVDLLNDQKHSQEEKLLWAIGMLLFHPFVAIAYYFVARHRH